MSNTITKDQVEKIARLAKLILGDKQAIGFSNDLSGVMGIIDEVQQVNTKNVVPTSQVTGLLNIYREDNVDLANCLSLQEVLSNAPAAYQGFIKVKAIF